MARNLLHLEHLEERTLLSFFPPVNYDVGFAPTAVATGDFNHDAALDLVVANRDSNRISILLGKANGSFQLSVSYAVGKSPRSLAVGDLNRDGNVDVAVANYDDATITALFGNGDGRFQAAQTYALNPAPHANTIALGDFLRDGNLDIVATDAGVQSGGVHVLLNKGDGTFQAPINYDIGGTRSVAVADFNHDQKMDFVVVTSGGLRLFLSNGNGTFRDAADFLAGGDSTKVSDVNGDGNLDIVGSSGATPPYQINVSLGQSDGSFPSEPTTYGVGSYPADLVIADFDGDGHQDVITANHDSNNLSFLKGVGDGTFDNVLSYNSGGLGPAGLAVGDFNGDGAPDLAVANQGSNNISVLLNRPEATSLRMTAPATVSVGAAFSFTLAALGFNQTLKTYSGTVHFGSSDPMAVLPDGTRSQLCFRCRCGFLS